MKINLYEIDNESFSVLAKQLPNTLETVYLVQPQHIGCKFTQANKFFRSSVWNSEGNLISAGFPKFVNWGENPDNFPVPFSLDNTIAVEKIDGSLLCVSKYKGDYIIRTRGTVDASLMEKNGHEIEAFKSTILPSISYLFDRFEHITMLFEWVSPLNQVVLHYNEPAWYLVGIVFHEDYSLMTQTALDDLALNHDLLRPKTYKFNSIEDLLALVKEWKGKEGICLYSNKGQTIHKIKSDDYLVKHRLKEQFSGIENVIEFFVSAGMPNYNEFIEKLSQVIDYETITGITGNISNVCDAWKQVKPILNYMSKTIDILLTNKELYKTRKDQAAYINEHWGNTGRSSMLFTLLDGKPLDHEHYKKLIYQVLKK